MKLKDNIKTKYKRGDYKTPETKKSITLSFRIDPNLNEVLRKRAEKEKKKISKLIEEVLIRNLSN